MKENAEGLIFRDSVIDVEGNVKCIIKWESKEFQGKFEKGMKKIMKENPKMMEEFGKIADMSTMTKEFLDIV